MVAERNKKIMLIQEATTLAAHVFLLQECNIVVGERERSSYPSWEFGRGHGGGSMLLGHGGGRMPLCT